MTTLTNGLKARFAQSEVSYGLWLSLGSSSATEALAHAGFDWLCIDTEHAPNDSRDVEQQLRAIAAAHLPSEPVVRVPSLHSEMVQRVLDAGARTLMFPAIESAEQARLAVRRTRYPDTDYPDGMRGVAGTVRAAGYGARRDYLQGANAQIAVMLQIESAAALAQVDAIAATPGVDCLFVGPADLAASLGHLGDTKHPEVEAAFAAIAQAAARAGIASGIFAMDVSSARRFRELGYTAVALAADVIWLVRATRQALQELRS
jgi:2-dehydro-3-deoxyglucarate aldolase